MLAFRQTPPVLVLLGIWDFSWQCFYSISKFCHRKGIIKCVETRKGFWRGNGSKGSRQFGVCALWSRDLVPWDALCFGYWCDYYPSYHPQLLYHCLLQRLQTSCMYNNWHFVEILLRLFGGVELFWDVERVTKWDDGSFPLDCSHYGVF